MPVTYSARQSDLGQTPTFSVLHSACWPNRWPNDPRSVWRCIRLGGRTITKTLSGSDPADGSESPNQSGQRVSTRISPALFRRHACVVRSADGFAAREQAFQAYRRIGPTASWTTSGRFVSRHSQVSASGRSRHFHRAGVHPRFARSCQILIAPYDFASNSIIAQTISCFLVVSCLINSSARLSK